MKTSTNTLTNLDYLKATCCNSQDMVDQIVTMFLKSTPELIAGIKSSLKDGNLETVKRNAHKAKSSFLMMGARTIAEKFEKIELASEPFKFQIISILLSEIEQESARVFNELKN